jgi:hypothetical protein
MITTLLLTAGLAIAQPATASARQPAQPGGVTTPVGAVSDIRYSPDANPPLVSLSFPGGTLEELAGRLRSLTKPPASIVVAPSLAGLNIGPISVADVTVDTALRAAVVTASPARAAVVSIIRGEHGSALYSVEPNQAAQSPFAASEKSTLQVFSLDRTGVENDVALSAIKAALDLLADPEEVKISFHKDSSLVMLHGSQRQIETVRMVLTTLEQSGASRANLSVAKSAASVLKALEIPSPEAAPERLAEIQARLKAVEQLRAETASIRAELDVAHARSKDTEGRAAALLAENEKLHADLRTISLDAERARLQLQNAQREIERLTIINAELQKFVDSFRKTAETKEPR